MNLKKTALLTLVILSCVAIPMLNLLKKSDLPLIAIANYGPHESLDAVIAGLKEALTSQGFIENEHVQYEIQNVNFDSSLIPQMVSGLMHANPKVMVAITTPVAQFVKSKVKDTPVVYSAVGDPVAAQLITNRQESNENITGCSDAQDFKIFLSFVKTLLPRAQVVGMLYSTAEINDFSSVNALQTAAKHHNMSVVAIPIDQPRDIAIRVQEFKNKVDLIYVNTSGPIQPALPIIAAEAQKMQIPVFNAEEQAVIKGIALASFGVNHISIGKITGELVGALLRDQSIGKLKPRYPTTADHQGFINKLKAKELGIDIPNSINAIIIE